MIPLRLKPISAKRLKQLTTGRAGTENAVWRKKVFERDDHTCQVCGAKNELQAHHIHRYSEATHLRYNICNGITLCKTCHHRVTGHEARYAVQFALKALENAKNNSRQSGTDPIDL